MLAERLAEYISACFTGIWVESHEHEDALAEIASLCRQQDWQLASWDIDRGLRAGSADQLLGTPSDPLAAIRALNSLSAPNTSSILVLTNFHRFLGSAEIVQALIQQIVAGKQNRTFVIILAPLVQIPVELEKLVVVLEHELPSREQLEQIAQGLATEEGELPQGAELNTVLDSAAGLTRYEAEAAFSLSLVRHGRIAAETIWELKSGMLKKSGLLSLHRSEDSFQWLGGLHALKAFCKRSLLQTTSGQPHKRARGVLLLGVPGTGKSAFAKSLGNETGRPTLSLDMGSLLGSLVGQSEQNIRQALKIADAMAPAILFIDECEKALSGVGNSGQTDSGVSARLFGSLLTWMNDHTSDVYLVATCNDIAKLPPEFSRAERFDGIFFLNLPGRTEKEAIWRMYQDRYELDLSQRLPLDENWTGAEIRSCCRLAALLDVPLVQAAQNVVPVAVTASEAIDRLRSWASGRCLDADQAGIYRRVATTRQQSRRSIPRDPSSN